MNYNKKLESENKALIRVVKELNARLKTIEEEATAEKEELLEKVEELETAVAEAEKVADVAEGAVAKGDEGEAKEVVAEAPAIAEEIAELVEEVAELVVGNDVAAQDEKTQAAALKVVKKRLMKLKTFEEVCKDPEELKEVLDDAVEFIESKVEEVKEEAKTASMKRRRAKAVRTVETKGEPELPAEVEKVLDEAADAIQELSEVVDEAEPILATVHKRFGTLRALEEAADKIEEITMNEECQSIMDEFELSKEDACAYLDDLGYEGAKNLLSRLKGAQVTNTPENVVDPATRISAIKNRISNKKSHVASMRKNTVSKVSGAKAKSVKSVNAKQRLESVTQKYTDKLNSVDTYSKIIAGLNV